MTTTAPAPQSIWKRVWFWVKFVEIRLRFIVLLAGTGLVVGYWEHIQNRYEQWQRNRSGAPAMIAAPAESDIEFFCPMHPFVVRDRKTKCPICGMDLSERRKGEAPELPEGVAARVQVSPERIMQSGVRVEEVLYRDLVRTVRTYGLIEADETLQTRLIARFPGRLDSLRVKSVGEVVKKGDLLAEIYSPEYFAAANEYLIAWRAWKAAESRGAAEAERARALVEISRRRLVLAGFTDEQFREIEESGTVGDHVALHAPSGGTVVERMVLEGDMVESGTALFTITDFSRVWIQAQVIESDIAAVTVGMPAEVTLVSYPGEIFRGTVDFIYPTVTPDSRTLRVRVVIDNAGGKLKPGMYATVGFRSPLGKHEVITPEQLAGAESAAPEEPLYWCPMHPEVTSTDPNAECEKCGGMKLIPKKRPAAAAAPSGLLTRTKGAGSPEPFSYGWSCDMHPEELEAAPGVCTTCGCGMELVPYRIEGVLAVPEMAVIDTGTRKIVYTEFADGIYDAREVVLGPRVDSWYQVLDGLSAGDRVVARGAFLIDAETRLNPAAAATYTGATRPDAHAAHAH